MAGRKKKKSNPLIILLALVCAGVMVFSGYKFTTTMLEYRRGTEEYDRLRLYAEAADNNSLQADAAGADGQLKCPIRVDFDALKKINEDVVGWLYIETLDLSYPIVHGEDNDYYLHRTFERKYNFAGSIFVEAENKPDFSDPHTIVYGHNMKNDSMFGMLDHLISEPERQENPYFWILTPEANYCYQMFSLHKVSVDSEIYTLFYGTDQTFVEFAEKMAASSEAELPEQTFTTDSRIVTLSTCTNDAGSRFVVQGVRTAALAPEGGSAGSDRAEEKKESGEEADPYEQFVEKNG